MDNVININLLEKFNANNRTFINDNSFLIYKILIYKRSLINIQGDLECAT